MENFFVVNVLVSILYFFIHNLGKADMDKLLPATSQNNAQTGNSNKPNNETEETFSPSSGTSADSSSSVTVAMENLSTDPDLASGAMDVDNEKDKDASTKKPDSNLHHQIKQIKPLLGKESMLFI